MPLAVKAQRRFDPLQVDAVALATELGVSRLTRGRTEPIGEMTMQVVGTVLAVVLLAGPVEPPRLGIAEEFSSGDWGSPVVPQVRVGFRRVEAGWEVYSEPVRREPALAAASEPVRVHLPWSVCFDGRVLGRLETEPVGSALHAREGVQVPVANQKIPFVGRRSREFAGWMGAEVHHPLAVSSQGHCSDPDGWHREQASPELRRRLFDVLRTSLSAEVCDGDVRSTWKPKSTDLELLKLHASKSGERLATLRAHLPKAACEDPQSEAAAMQLLRIDRQGTITRIGTGLVVIDAGDYHGDGKSEVLFKYERYNDDGYALFYDDLSKQVSLGWHYH